MDNEDKLKRKSLKSSFLDGIFASCMVGFTQEYLVPFLLLLGATVRHVAVLNALPNLFASLAQLGSAGLAVKLKSRMKVINIFIFLQALMLLPMAIIALSGFARPYIFITAVVLFTSLGAIAMPAWGSLMSDLISENKRGEYFGWRNRILGFIVVASTFAAGFILNRMNRINAFYGFAIIFSLAFVFRIISWYFLIRMYEPHLKTRQEHCFTLLDFLKRIRESNFARFALFVASITFSVNLAAPFFAVLMLKGLGFSYLLYTLIAIAATLAIYLSIRRWGLHADKVGNIKVVKLTSRIIAIIPLLWICNRHPVYLVFAQIIAGFAWAGFNLCASNFIYDAVTPEKRTRCIAYFNVINGTALCAGALIGGLLVQRLPALLGYKILTLFLIPSAIRVIVAFLMPIRLKEVRPVEKVSSNRLFFSMIGIKPLIAVDRETIKY